MLLKLRPIAFIVAALGLLAATCAACGDGPPDGADGGREAGPEDAASRDAPADARQRADAGTPRDAGRGSRPDAAADASPPVDAGPAGWTPLEGIPEGCRIERATNPGAVFTSRWEPCDHGLEGCQKIIKNMAVTGNGAFDGDRALFYLGRNIDSRRLIVLAQSEGPALGAWLGPRGIDLPEDGLCQLGAPTVSSDGAAFVIRTGASLRPDWRNTVFHGAPDVIGSLDTPVGVLTPELIGGGTPQRMDVSATTVASEVQSGVFIAQDGALVRRELDALPQSARVVGDHVLWEEWGRRVRVVHGTIDQEASVFYEIDGDVKGFDTDGVDMAWVQGYDRQPDGSYERVELWTAPYVRDPADIEPRMVRSLPTRITLATVGGGYWGHWLYANDEWTLNLYRLSDGRKRQWVFPPDDSPGSQRPPAISEDEVLVPGVQLRRVQMSAIPFVD
jgi:hypothetical protein